MAQKIAHATAVRHGFNANVHKRLGHLRQCIKFCDANLTANLKAIRVEAVRRERTVRELEEKVGSLFRLHCCVGCVPCVRHGLGDAFAKSGQRDRRFDQRVQQT